MTETTEAKKHAFAEYFVEWPEPTHPPDAGEAFDAGWDAAIAHERVRIVAWLRERAGAAERVGRMLIAAEVDALTDDLEAQDG